MKDIKMKYNLSKQLSDKIYLHETFENIEDVCESVFGSYDLTNKLFRQFLQEFMQYQRALG